MSIELSLLKSFIAIVDEGNFVLAAQAAGKSPSSVTMQIKRLEDVVGASLFLRDARGTRLTQAGERLVPHARRMLAMETEILTSFQPGIVQGEVRLGVPDDVVEQFPMETLRRFRDEHPAVTLTVSVDHTPALLRKVDRDVLDLTIITYAESLPGVRESQRIWFEREVWATSRTGIASERQPLPVALWEKGWTWHKPTVEGLEESGLDYIIVLQCENIGARRAAIAADLAIGPLPLSQMGPDLVAVNNRPTLPALPDYGLGLKVRADASAAVETVAAHIRSHYQTRAQRAERPAGETASVADR